MENDVKRHEQMAAERLERWERAVDVVVERQWHVGLHVRSLEKLGLVNRVYGGFPAFRYRQLGIDGRRLRCRAWETLWNECCRRSGLPRGWQRPVQASLGRWVARQRDLAHCVVCYSTVYRWLFPLLEGRPQVRVLERGSTHPENFFRQIALGRQEAGLPFEEGLAPGVLDEIAAGHLAHFVVAGSAEIRDSYIQRGYAPDRILTIPYATDPELFRYFERPARGCLRIACVGMIGIRKGLVRLLRLGEWLEKKGVRHELVLIGPLEPEAKPLLAQTRACWSARGVLKGGALVAALHECDLYALLSYEEGFGISILEAMSTGLPVLVSREAGGREAVTEGPAGDGVILDAYDEATFDARVGPLVGDARLRAEMGRRARVKILSAYTPAHYTATIAEEYGRMFALIEKESAKIALAYGPQALPATQA